VLSESNFPADEIEVHLGLCYLQAKHGHEWSQEHQIKC